MPKEKSWVPWYRRKDYDGSLSEEEKRLLDSFRMKDKHPAECREDIPDEILNYISGVEFELYDLKQDSAAGTAIAISVFSAFLIYFAYTGQAYSTVGAYLFGVFLFVAAWVRYRWVWNKNAEEFHPKSVGAPNRTDEGIRKEWELDYIVREQRRKSDLDEIS